MVFENYEACPRRIIALPCKMVSIARGLVHVH